MPVITGKRSVHSEHCQIVLDQVQTVIKLVGSTPPSLVIGTNRQAATSPAVTLTWDNEADRDDFYNKLVAAVDAI